MRSYSSPLTGTKRMSQGVQQSPGNSRKARKSAGFFMPVVQPRPRASPGISPSLGGVLGYPGCSALGAEMGLRAGFHARVHFVPFGSGMNTVGVQQSVRNVPTPAPHRHT